MKYYKLLIFIIFISNLVFTQTMIKFATLAPQGTLWGNCLESIKMDVYNQTEKRVRIKVYYGGKMGDEDVMVKKIKINYLHGGAFTGRGLGAITQEIRILETPRIIRTYEEVDYLQEKLFDDFDKEFMANGFKLLGLIDTGFAYFFSKKDIKSIDDIRNTKMWLWQGDELVYAYMNVFNIKAKALDFVNVVPSLQTGMIDSFYTTPMAAIALQWFSEANYMLDYKIANVTGGLVISKKVWDTLSKEDQVVVISVAKKHLRQLVLDNRLKDEESIEILKKNNIIINKTAGNMVEMDKKSVEVKKSLEDKLYSKEISEKVDQLLKEYRSK